jgi:protein TonB
MEAFALQDVQTNRPLPSSELPGIALPSPELAPAFQPLEPASVLQSDSLPQLIQYRAPEYPRSAIVRGVEGEVVLSFRISADGRPADIEVLSADPPRESSFVLAARTALLGWRFESPGDEQARVRRAFEFKLADSDESHRCKVHTGSRLCRR